MQDDFCRGNNSGVDQCVSNQDSSSLSDYRFFFYFGQFLLGVGNAPLYTLGNSRIVFLVTYIFNDCEFVGIVYLDENLLPNASAMYLGVFYSMSIVGPAFGYILGGVFLGYYTDFDQAPDEKYFIKYAIDNTHNTSSL